MVHALLFRRPLESGNVCEYFPDEQYFNSLGIKDHDRLLYDMGMKEKEHEVYFLEGIEEQQVPPLFEKLFLLGKHSL